MAPSELPAAGAGHEPGDAAVASSESEASRSGDHPGIEHRDLRSVIDFALLVAAEGRRRRPPLEIPDELRHHLDGQHVSKRALGRIRRAIDASPEFRARLATGLRSDPTIEVVDDVGWLWLERPAGWREEVDALLAARASAAAAADDERSARREEKRRIAAEQARDRAEAELAARQEELARLRREVDDLRADLQKAQDENSAQVEELRETRLEVRHARDRERAALDRLATAERARSAAEHERARTEEVRDGVLADRADAVTGLAEVEAAAEQAQALADQLRSLLPSDVSAAAHVERRVPMGLPGGVISTSGEAAEFFARSDAAILVDGYNVSKLIWATRSLEQQRDALLDAVENVARRFGTDITVVFDGADVVGAHSARRRLVRVTYSPDGVTADDLIRDEVRRLPSSRPVVVVTDDREIVHDVRSWGANPLPSGAFATLL